MSQPLQALEVARRVATERSRVCRSLRDGEITFADLALDDPCLRTMTVLDLLRSLPWSSAVQPGGTFRRTAIVKPTRLLRDSGIPQTFTVGRLTERQRDSLRVLVARDCPTQRVTA